MELKTSGKTLLLSHQKKRKSKQQGLTNKHHEKMAMQEEHALKHCSVDVKGDKRACYATKVAAVFAACIRGILEYPYKRSKTRNGVPTWVNHILPLH
jgi:hypothetical protein